MRTCRKCGSTEKPFKKHSGNMKTGICLECHREYCKRHREKNWVALIQTNNELKSAVKDMESSLRYIFNISRDPAIGECAKYQLEKHKKVIGKVTHD